jgi:hypothetical protein
VEKNNFRIESLFKFYNQAPNVITEGAATGALLVNNRQAEADEAANQSTYGSGKNRKELIVECWVYGIGGLVLGITFGLMGAVKSGPFKKIVPMFPRKISGDDQKRADKKGAIKKIV